MQSQLSREWSPPRGLVVVGWILAAAAVLWLVFADSTVDRMFVGVLVFVLVTIATYAAIVRPRLVVDGHGITVRGLRGTRSWPWSSVRVRLRRTQRLGRTVETLELDVPADELIVLTRFDLGADPADVHDSIQEIRS